MAVTLTTLPRTLLIAGALALAPALAFAQTQTAPVAPAAAITTPAAPAVKPVAAVKTPTAPVKPVAHVHSKKVAPKLQPAASKMTAPAAPTTPKS